MKMEENIDTVGATESSSSWSRFEGDVDRRSPPLTVTEFHKEYKVLRHIASGTFGSVYCVQRRDNKVIRAAKYLKSCDDDLQSEISALQVLRSCPFILQFFALYHPSNGVHSILVTEFLAGGDLCERTSAPDFVLTEQKCRIIVRQICHGLSYMHSHHFVHLDLKPFNVVFAQVRDDYDLRIIDFGLAVQLESSQHRRNVGLRGTLEYMSPEVMNCEEVSTSADMWGVGCIAYQLLSGGISPFYAVNRFRTMARVLDVDYTLDKPELRIISEEAKDFVSSLLVKDPRQRLTAEQCLDHSWLRDDAAYLGLLEMLETTWMRRCLARRRWYRLLNTLRVTFSLLATFPVANDTSSEDDLSSDFGASVTSTPVSTKPPFVHNISVYRSNFQKLHLKANKGLRGTLFIVKKVLSSPQYQGVYHRGCQVFCARHVLRRAFRSGDDSALLMRREADLLHHLRNSDRVIQLEGLYEGIRQSILVTDFLAGGDLVERLSSSDFVLNEVKCRHFMRQISSGLRYIHTNRILHLNLTPFSIFFANVRDDSVLKIAHFHSARRLEGDGLHLKILPSMSGSVEFVAPEMIECTWATTATDCWNLGVIAYMLLSGGKSPFYANNRFRTVARILTCNITPESSAVATDLKNVSFAARSFVTELLVLEPSERATAAKCLQHDWLISEGGGAAADTLLTLETRWMKQLLSRRRWHRWFNAVRATQRIRKFSVKLSPSPR